MELLQDLVDRLSNLTKECQCADLPVILQSCLGGGSLAFKQCTVRYFDLLAYCRAILVLGERRTGAEMDCILGITYRFTQFG